MAPSTPRSSALAIAAAVLALGSAVGSAAVAHAAPEPLPPLPPPGPGTVLPPVDLQAPGRVSDQLAQWAGLVSAVHHIPTTALQAYGHAAAVAAAATPECGLTWPTLAGIGFIETWHGTYEGAHITPIGRAEPPIRGIALDGRPGIATIKDTDGGRLDGDTEHDRAMGPMQFIPETWARWGTDGNGDGVADPDNVDDAALSAARYLCNRGGNLSTEEGWVRAVRAYNASNKYILDVHAKAVVYSAPVDIPPPPPPPVPAEVPPPPPPVPAEVPPPPPPVPAEVPIPPVPVPAAPAEVPPPAPAPAPAEVPPPVPAEVPPQP